MSRKEGREGRRLEREQGVREREGEMEGGREGGGKEGGEKDREEERWMMSPADLCLFFH